jgi:hypothetical protein
MVSPCDAETVLAERGCARCTWCVGFSCVTVVVRSCGAHVRQFFWFYSRSATATANNISSAVGRIRKFEAEMGLPCVPSHERPCERTGVLAGPRGRHLRAPPAAALHLPRKGALGIPGGRRLCNEPRRRRHVHEGRFRVRGLRRSRAPARTGAQRIADTPGRSPRPSASSTRKALRR